MSFVLGIDLGTTSVKVVILDASNKKVAATVSQIHNAEVSNLSPRFNEQKVSKIFSALERCMQRLEEDHSAQLVNVKCLVVCGQMHGSVCYPSSVVNGRCDEILQAIINEKVSVSNLITWQDTRADESFLSSLTVPKHLSQVSSGFGCVNILWLMKNNSKLIDNFNRAATIADFLVAVFCSLAVPKMTTQNASSWGYLNREKTAWNMQQLSSEHFPVKYLPDISSDNAPVGRLNGSWHSVPDQTLVFPAFGDFQCTVFSKLTENSAIMNISTSAQLCFRKSNEFHPSMLDYRCDSSISYFPYFDNSYLAVAASLNGGNVLNEFVNILTTWCSQLTGTACNVDTTWAKLAEILSQPDSSNDPKAVQPNFTIHPTLFGERHSPTVGFSLTNVHSADSLTLKAFAQQLVLSIVRNLNEMMSKGVLKENGIFRLILTGQAAKLFWKREVEKIYGTELIIDSINDDCTYDAALGGALVGCQYIGNK